MQHYQKQSPPEWILAGTKWYMTGNFDGATDESGVDFFTWSISGSAESTGDSGADDTNAGGDETAHGTIPRHEICAGKGFNNDGGDCSRAEIDGELVAET